MSGRLIMKLTVAEQAAVTADVATFAFAHPRRPVLPAWVPGAHVDVHLPDGAVRQYSLYGDPAERGLYRIAVKREEAGRGGSRWIHDHLRPGGEIFVSAPRNHFALNPDAARHVLVAGGIGVTPLMAMARQLAAQGDDFVFHYCARSRQSAPLVETLEALCGDRLRLWLSAEGRRLDIAAALDAEAGADLYVCGPNALTDAAEGAAAARGWPEARYHTEHFAARADAGFVPEPFEAVIASSGRRLAVPADRSLLDVLRDNGFVRGSSCEIGVCGTCECGYRDGAVIHRDVVLSHAARKSRLMPCVSRGRGAITLDL
jgi:vanillate O-demethylase ferredoxin subunit